MYAYVWIFIYITTVLFIIWTMWLVQSVCPLNFMITVGVISSSFSIHTPFLVLFFLIFDSNSLFFSCLNILFKTNHTYFTTTINQKLSFVHEKSDRQIVIRDSLNIQQQALFLVSYFSSIYTPTHRHIFWGGISLITLNEKNYTNQRM